MSIINYAVEIITDTAITDTDYALQSGVIRLITGRPGYDGGTPYPTWEDTTNNTAIWYEGWLIKDGMGRTSRRIDLMMGGDYGSASGFSFKLRNNTAFFNYIESNDIYLTNRLVKVYAVITNVFYQIYEGVISEQPYSETDYTIDCIDAFKTLHKMMPPNEVNETEYPDATKETLGDPIPISIGDITYAKLVKLSPLSKAITLLDYGPNRFAGTVCMASRYAYATWVDPGHPYKSAIGIITIGVSFAENELKGKYICAVQGKDANTTKLIYIRANAESDESEYQYGKIFSTQVGLEEPLDKMTYEIFNDVKNHIKWESEDGDVYHLGYEEKINRNTTSDAWWFSILEMSPLTLVSNSTIKEFLKDKNGNLQIYTYDKNKNEFSLAVDSLLGQEEVDGKTLITAIASSTDETGQVEVVAKLPISGRTPVLYDIDPATYYDVSATSDADVWHYRTFDVDLTDLLNATKNSQNTLLEDIDKVYMGADFTIFKTGATSTKKLNILYRYVCYDIYGHYMAAPFTKDNDLIFEDLELGPDEVEVNILPTSYYRYNKDVDYKERSSSWGDIVEIDNDAVRLADNIELAAEIVDGLKRGTISKVDLGIGYKAPSAGDEVSLFTLRVRQIGLFGIKTIDTVDSDLYASIKGESLTDGTYVDNVYNTFKLILEEYDGISSSEISYDNLQACRRYWPVARQIMDKKNSFEYLKELAQQSFVCIYPTREGKRRLSCWREKSRSSATHNDAIILRDSISEVKKTSLAQVYNEFYIEYGYNQASKKFERSISIKKIDQTAFPAVTDTTWRNYVTGLNENSYATAKAVWDVCHAAYLKTKSIALMEGAPAKCYWYSDSTINKGEENVGVSIDDSVYKYLSRLVEWVTRQKAIVKYDLPLTSTHLARELTDRITFSDALYTYDLDQEGWITGIEVDPKKDLITIEIMLEPPEMDEDAIIIELGDNDDTLDETGANTDVVEET